MSDVHAAIDIGTNSIHLVVARALPGGGFDVVTTEKESVRLGSGSGDMKRLEPDAIERGVAALAHMIEVATSFGAEITAVATSAVREAENREDFVNRVRSELGLSVDVISGYEEARLIHHGVIHAIPLADQRALIVDIGGGSTEFIIGEGSELVEARSLRLGAMRLTQRFFGSTTSAEKPSSADIARCRTFLQVALDGVSRDLGGHRPEMAIGSSGTITAVASMIGAARDGDMRQINGFTFTADELQSIGAEVLSLTGEARRKIRGLDDRRADIIVGGILLLDEIFAAFDLRSMTMSEFALREGVLFDHFPAGLEHLQDLRLSNARRLARQLDPDADHAETVARLSGQLFDRTAELHGLGPDAKQLLGLAAIVHNVGLFISHSSHHKHTQYIVRNSEQLTGFSEQEIELIALITRYHRKSFPSEKHHDFSQLGKSDRQLVRTLSGLLRVAIGFDRRHSGRVSALRVRPETDPSTDASRLVIEPVVSNGEDVAVEVAAARERSELLALALGVDIVVQESVVAST